MVGRSPPLRSGSGHQPSGPQPASQSSLGGVPNARLRVTDYINAAKPEAVIAEYREHYAEDGWDNCEAFEQFRRVLNGKIGIQRTDNMRVLIRWSDASEWGDAHYDVGGADDTAANWSLSFTPWGEWKLLPVEDASGKRPTTDQIAAHLYNEISWYGWEESAASVRDDVLDAKEAVDRGLVKLTPIFPDEEVGTPR